MALIAYVSRGPNKGKPLVAHRHKDGKYVVSKTRFARDYIRVDSESNIAKYVAAGYSVRMSNRSDGISPSLISPNSISFS